MLSVVLNGNLQGMSCQCIGHIAVGTPLTVATVLDALNSCLMCRVWALQLHQPC